ncbi:response regulator [Azospirillum sp. ST 5-10]|uniref:hybrid sensor histidine kinase/response regulator n=1 Tax=unclassified Azospirillum TaxID=2630922 RepID=UPI003F49CFA8
MKLIAALLVLASMGHALFDALDESRWEALWAVTGSLTALLLLLLVFRREAAVIGKAQASVTLAEHRLAEAIGTINEGFALFDGDDRLVVCNEPFRAFYALSGPVAPGVVFRDLLRAGAERGQYADCDPADHEDWIAERLRHHRMPSRPLELRLGNGRWVKVNERRTADGGFVGIHTDITELKRREDELRESEERFRKLSDAATDAILVHENGIVLDANRAAVALTGRPLEGLIGLPVLALVVPEDHDLVRRRLAERRDDRFEVTCRRVDGERRIVEGETRQTTHHGRPVTIVSAHDITVHRTAEAQLRFAKEQAERASQAKSDFLRMISHELRTPLNGVLGTIGLLLDGPLGEEQRLYAQTARESGEALLTILNDILDLSKMEAGKLVLEANRFSPVDVVESAVGLLAARAAAKGIALVACVPGGLPAAVRGDAGRLRQVLLNLAGNAVKFTERGGVAVCVSAADGHGDESSVALRFEVTDTGIGIPEDARPTLFTEFTQVDPMLSRRYGGTGLGLAISKRLVEAMGGSIGFDSRPGGGSRFWFVVPFERVPGAAEGAMPLDGRRLLLIDAQPVSRRTLATQLRSWGAEVAETADLAAAQERSCAAAPDAGFDTALIDANALPAGDADLEALVPALHRAGVGRLVLMTLVGHAVEGRGRDLAAVVVKPVRQGRLLAALGAGDEPAPRPAAPAGPAVGAGGGRILLAEDSPTNQMVAVAILKAAGHQVDVAANGLEAVEAARTLPYDLVLMDIAMPEMDGLEAARALRALPPPAGALPIVAMTADAMEGDRERCLAAGMNDHIAKPVDRLHLLQTVARWLRAPEPAAPTAAARPAGSATADREDPAMTAPIREPATPPPEDSAPAGLTPAGPEAAGPDLANPDLANPDLDAGVLAQLAEDLDADLVADLVRQFVQETRDRVRRIAGAELDAATLQREAHTLKSTAGTFGARRLAQRARDLEQACREGDGDAMAAMRRDVAVLARAAEEAYRTRGLLDPADDRAAAGATPSPGC